MLSFVERIRKLRMVWRWEIWTDAARTGGEEGKKGAEEDGGDHQRLSSAFSESLCS